MALRIHIARRPGALRALFEGRHRVFVDEEGYLPRESSGAIVDLYDALGTTANFCATVDGAVVGGVRVTLDSDAGIPADDAFDFDRPSGARVGACGRMFVTRAHRDDARVIVGLLQMSMYWAVQQRCTHLYGIVNPPALDLVRRIGFRAVGPRFTTQDGLLSVPVALDVTQLAPDYAAFVRRQDVGRTVEDFERWFFRPGEVVGDRLERKRLAFLVVEGRVAEQGAHPGQVGDTYTRGQILGKRLIGGSRAARRTFVALDPTTVARW